MSPLAVHFLRRLALWASIASIAIFLVPRALLELGVIGPASDEAIDAAARAVDAARTYGAPPELPAFQDAAQKLGTARAFQSEGRDREARHAAAQATTAAIEAQRQSLVRREEVRQKARSIYDDLDQQLIDLEKLYDQRAAGFDKAATAERLALMKATRQSTGGLFLAFEQEDYERVVGSEIKVRTAVAEARKIIAQEGTLTGAATQPSAPGTK